MSTQQNALTLPPSVASRRSRVLASRWTALAVVLAGTFMVVLDFFIVNVALPSMQADLHASSGAIQWVVAGYAAGHGLLLATVAEVGVGGSIGGLVPGLLLVGAGMGLLIVPLTSTIMAAMKPAHVGAATGALATMQSLGGALGVAVTGAVFFGAVQDGYARAFELSLAQLAALLLVVALLTRLLPAPERAR
jgi:MFS family permease